MKRIIALLAVCIALPLPVAAREVDLTRPVTLRGSVMAPDGSATAARVRIVTVDGKTVAETNSDESGEYAIEVRPATVRDKTFNRNWKKAVVVAESEPHCPCWISLEAAMNNRSTKLQLVRDMPIEGAVLDSSGKPVPDASIELLSMYRFSDENLDWYLKQFRDRVTVLDHSLSRKGIYGPIPLVFEDKKITADKRGRFAIRGVGRERVLQVNIKGKSIAGQSVWIITRPKIEAKWKRNRLSKFDQRMDEGTMGGARIPVVYAANLKHVASPAASITGFVTAKDTGKPLANIRISGQMNSSGGASAVTDENGKYTLTGLPSRGSVNLYAICPDGLAYVNASRRDNAYSATTPPENADFELSPGIVARGSVTDTAGVPVRARVSYLCLRNNEYAQDMTDSFGSYGSRETDENGDYEIVVIPGQGVITAVANGDREFEKASFEGLGLPLNRGVNNGMLSTINRGIVRGEHYDAVALISPKSLDDEVTVHLKLREGNQVVGRLVDAKGEAVRYAKWWQPERNFGDQLESAEFVVGGLRDGEERRIVFRHEKLRLGAVVEVGKHSKSPVTVKLRPYATITGRLVNKSGQPIAKARYAAITAGTTAKLQESRGQRSALKHRPVVSGEGETDADGRFRIDEIIPGHKCELAAGEPGSRLPRALKQLSLRSGESRDLGDVVLK